MTIDKIKIEYKENGYIVLRNFLDIKKEIIPVHQEVNSLIDIKLKQLGLKRISPNYDQISNDDFFQIINVDRGLGGDIYRACRHLFSLHKLVMNDKLLDLSKRLMNTELINILSYIAIRIDIPSEEKYLFPWHQDYPYTQGSIDGVVFWIPFFDVKIGEGNLKIIPGSHKHGIHKVKIIGKESKESSGAHSLEISNIESFDKMECIEVDIKAGDAIVFNTLLMHRSTESKSSNIRWTSQIRYANFLNEDSIKRGWPSGMFEGETFQEKHPEYSMVL